MTAVLIHAALVAVFLICYTVLTATGNDGNPILLLLGGQGLGAGAQVAAEKVDAKA